jgi:hypothetical protein
VTLTPPIVTDRSSMMVSTADFAQRTFLEHSARIALPHASRKLEKSRRTRGVVPGQSVNTPYT